MDKNPATLHPIARITSFFTTLQPDSLARLEDYYNDRIHFLDPINEGSGIADLHTIFQDLFKQLKDISFDVTVSRGDEKEAFLKWVMRYHFRSKERELPGVSYLSFDKEGKVINQQDFWDASAGVFEEVPGLGTAIRSLRKKVQVVPK